MIEINVVFALKLYRESGGYRWNKNGHIQITTKARYWLHEYSLYYSAHFYMFEILYNKKIFFLNKLS